jgi:hypothetical protein
VLVDGQWHSSGAKPLMSQCLYPPGSLHGANAVLLDEGERPWPFFPSCSLVKGLTSGLVVTQIWRGRAVMTGPKAKQFVKDANTYHVVQSGR